MTKELNLKIKLDTNLKEISVEGNPNLKDLFKGLQKLLPKDSPFGSWEDYKINTNSTINWFPYYIYRPYNIYDNWWTQPKIMYANTGSTGNYLNYANSVVTTNGSTSIGHTDNFKAYVNTDTLELPKEQEGIYYIEL
jgi:hypothetical protein